MSVIDFGADGAAEGQMRSHWSEPRGAAGDRARYAAAVMPDGLGGRVGRLMNYVGAMVSVLLMGGLGVWGWNLVTRDVSAVPVIRALEGAARVAPANPGGEASAHEGLAVNEVPAGVAMPPQAEVVIAPAPVGLTAEDVAMGRFGALAAQPGAISELVPDQAQAPALPLPDAEVARLAAAQAEAAAEPADESDLASAPATDAPVDTAVTDLSGAPAEVDAITAAVAEAAPELAPVPGPRPAPRPARIVAAAPAAAAPAAAAPAAPAPQAAPVRAAEAAPAPEAEASAPKGAMVVQIGAFDSDALARGEWSRVAGRNGDLFGGKSPLVQKTEKNGRTFWRLRVAGFGSRDEARSFCASLKAKGTDCIPTAAK